MSERSNILENSWLLIPFYNDPLSPSHGSDVRQFGTFLERAKTVTNLQVAVIDDGSGLTTQQLQFKPDLLLRLPENHGKSFAVRTALDQMLHGYKSANPDFIVQYDGDGDQTYKDIPRVYDQLVNISGANPDNPTLIIGDRYSKDLAIEPNPHSIEYRQTLLTFFGAIASQLGFQRVRDWVSGARGYTKAYAEGLVQKGRSSRYGLESEQLVVASLIGAQVGTAALTESRPRDPDTLTSKWLQNFEVYPAHEGDLRNQGRDNVVNLVQQLIGNLRVEHDTFSLDLSPLGEDTSINFKRGGDRYSASIPWSHRSKLFVSDDSFAMYEHQTIGNDRT